MPKLVYEVGMTYKNGTREITIYSLDGNTIFYKENGERKKMAKRTFYDHKFEPVKPLVKFGVRAKATQTRQQSIDRVQRLNKATFNKE